MGFRQVDNLEESGAIKLENVSSHSLEGNRSLLCVSFIWSQASLAGWRPLLLFQKRWLIRLARIHFKHRRLYIRGKSFEPGYLPIRKTRLRSFAPSLFTVIRLRMKLKLSTAQLSPLVLELTTSFPGAFPIRERRRSEKQASNLHRPDQRMEPYISII